MGDTKYYSARVRYCCVDVGENALNAEVLEMLQTADAIIFLWDVASPEALTIIQRTGKEALGLLDAEADFDDEEEEDPERDRVQLCVAVETRPPDDAMDKNEDDARSWCARNGFEHLRCTFNDSDFDAIRERRRLASAGKFGGLLDTDTDGTAMRILEAIECYQWPGLEKRVAASGARKDCSLEPAKPPEAELQLTETDIPTVVVVGDSGVGKRTMVQALTQQLLGSQSNADRPTAEATLETKYYRARLRFHIVDIPG